MFPTGQNDLAPNIEASVAILPYNVKIHRGYFDITFSYVVGIQLDNLNRIILGNIIHGPEKTASFKCNKCNYDNN